MKRLASVLLLLVSAALLAAAAALYRRQAPNADIAALMRASVAQIPAETLAAVRDGRLAEARRKLADLAVAQPTNPIVRYELGKLLQDSFREYADAIPEYVAFLRLAPDSAMAADAQSRLDGIRRELQQRYGRAETVVPETSPVAEDAERRLEALRCEYNSGVLASAELAQAGEDRDEWMRQAGVLQRQVESLQKALNAVQPGAVPTVVAAGPRIWTVQERDTLTRIAQKAYGDASFVKAIRDANPDKIGPDDRIAVGTELVIP